AGPDHGARARDGLRLRVRADEARARRGARDARSAHLDAHQATCSEARDGRARPGPAEALRRRGSPSRGPTEASRRCGSASPGSTGERSRARPARKRRRRSGAQAQASEVPLPATAWGAQVAMGMLAWVIMGLALWHFT